MEWQALFPPGSRVIALPNWQRPRLLLAGEDPLTRWQRARCFPAYRPGAGIRREYLRLKAAAGGGEEKAVKMNRWPLQEFVGERLPVASVTVLVGTEGPTQKLTARLQGRHGECVGFLKVAWKPGARRRLKHERAVLAALPPGVGPTVLRSGRLCDTYALLLAPLPGTPPPAAFPQPGSLRPFLEVLHRELEGLQRGEGVEIELHPWAQPLHRFPPELEPSVEVLSRRKWRVVINHGDFAPWNLLGTRAGGLRAIDWEFGSISGLEHVDLIHYLLQVGALIYRWPAAVALERTVHFLRRAPWPCLERRQAESLVRLAAHRSYELGAGDGILPSDPLQQWRRELWKAPLK